MLLVTLPLIAAALALLAGTPEDGRYAEHLLPSMLLMGVGGGLAFPALMMLGMSEATPENAGLASGLLSTTAQVGGALGLAVLATLAATRTEEALAGGASLAAALTSGYHVAFVVSASLVVLAVLLAAFVLKDVPVSAEHTY